MFTLAQCYNFVHFGDLPVLMNVSIDDLPKNPNGLFLTCGTVSYEISVQDTST